MKLLAPSPGWTIKADVIIVGSGIAGLTTALQVRANGLSVLLVTKLALMRVPLNGRKAESLRRSAQGIHRENMKRTRLLQGQDFVMLKRSGF